MPELALSTGFEAKLNSIEEKLSELEDTQLLTKLDIISMKERIEKLVPAGASPELDEKIRTLQDLAGSEKLQGIEKVMSKVDNLEARIEGMGAQKPAADIGSVLDAKIDEKLSDIRKQMKSVGGLKDVDFGELEKKISLVEKSDIASLRDELKAKIENVEKKVDDVRAVPAPATSQKYADEKLAAMKAEFDARVSGVENSVKLATSADQFDRMKGEIQSLKESAISDMDSKIKEMKSSTPVINTDAIKGEMFGELQKFKSDVLTRIDRLSNDMDMVSKAQPDFAKETNKLRMEYQNAANFRVSMADELNKKADDVKKTIESEIPYHVEIAEKEIKSKFDALQHDVSDLMILKKDTDSLRQSLDKAKSQNLDQIGQRISALESKQEWAESELLKKDLTAVTERLNELERRIRSIAVSMPIFIE
ncbi:MAG: hypothetical protein V1731_01075 [Candidatus Aenigmatarchaeota archaeon]